METNQKLVEGTIQRLDALLGDRETAITPENFATNKIVIEQILFPAAEHLGINIGPIKSNYQLELLQSSGGPDHPSSGRLRYIKGRLQKLSEKLKQYQSSDGNN